ncbi:MAG: DUF2812 domain-containing protein [Anaerovoracaceae bacterium]|jgi:hypothetical protein
MTKTVFKSYLLTDYEAEEQWLHEMYLKGWKLVSAGFPYMYTFEKVEPKDVTYRLEFRPENEDSESYIRMAEDYGWSFLQGANSWMYFWKETSEKPSENEIFSDDVSRMQMVKKTAMARYIPCLIILLVLLVLYVLEFVSRGNLTGIILGGAFLLILFAVDLHLLIGYLRLSRKYSG